VPAPFDAAGTFAMIGHLEPQLIEAPQQGGHFGRHVLHSVMRGEPQHIAVKWGIPPEFSESGVGKTLIRPPGETLKIFEHISGDWV